MTFSKVTITMYVNADPQETWEIMDEWIGKTAPEEVDSFGVHVEPEEES